MTELFLLISSWFLRLRDPDIYGFSDLVLGIAGDSDENALESDIADVAMSHGVTHTAWCLFDLPRNVRYTIANRIYNNEYLPSV